MHYAACSWGGEAAVVDESAAATATAGATAATEKTAATNDRTDAAAATTADAADAATDTANVANGHASDDDPQHADMTAAAYSDEAAMPDVEAQPAADDDHTATAAAETAAVVATKPPAPGILRLRTLLLRSQDFAERLWRPRKEWTSVEAAIAAQQCRHLSRAVTANGALCRWLPVNTAVYLALLQWREQTAVSVIILL